VREKNSSKRAGGAPGKTCRNPSRLGNSWNHKKGEHCFRLQKEGGQGKKNGKGEP